MINVKCVSRYCSKDISLIENYEIAVNDNVVYDCHHRLEAIFTKSQLEEFGLYYNRTPNELIFLPHSEHTRVHMTGEGNAFYGKHHSEETCKRLSELHKGKKLSEETKLKMSEKRKGEGNSFYGKHHSDKTKKQLSSSLSTSKHFSAYKNNLKRLSIEYSNYKSNGGVLSWNEYQSMYKEKLNACCFVKS